MLIVPSILTPSVSDLWNQIKRLSPFYNWFQIDIADEVFGKNLTFKIDELINTISVNKDLTSNNTFDFHLMVENTEETIEKISKIKNLVNLNVLFIQYKTGLNNQLLYDKYGLKIGIVLDPDDSVDEFIKNYDIKTIENIMILAVYPGAQGQDFQEQSLNKIEQLRSCNYRYKIFLDGGVNEKTIPFILSKKFKPDILTPGSFFSKAEDIKKQYEIINLLLKNS